MATTPNYDINYNDTRFKKLETVKDDALNEIDETYGKMIGASDDFYQKQINEADKYAEQQKQLQQQQTDFAIEKINQQKEQAEQDYTKEQSGSYVDWQKQSNEYGANAEQMAAQGMTNSGYSESSQVSMFNTYQNRVATARESYLRTIQNFDNAINEAKIQNNAFLAEIAYNAMQKGLELSLEGFQYKNQLIIDKANKKMEVEQVYDRRYQDVLDQINKENSLAEEVRQFNQSLLEEQRQHDALHGNAVIDPDPNGDDVTSVTGTESAENKNTAATDADKQTQGATTGNGDDKKISVDFSKLNNAQLDWESVDDLGLGITRREQLYAYIQAYPDWFKVTTRNGITRVSLTDKAIKERYKYASE